MMELPVRSSPEVIPEINKNYIGGTTINVDTKKETETELSFWRTYRGIIFALLGTLFYALLSLVMKQLSHYHPITVSLWYYAGVLIPAIFYYVANNLINRSSESIFASIFPVDSRDKVVLLVAMILRLLFGTTAETLHVWSLDYLSLGDSAIFAFSTTIFIVFFAHCCLNEKCGFVPIGISIFAIFGIFLIVRPPLLTGEASLDMNNLYGVIIAVVSLISESLMGITLRRIREVNWLLVLLSFGLFGLLETLGIGWGLGVLTLPVGIMDSILAYVALPLSVCASNICVTNAFKFEEAGRVSIVSTLGIVFSFLLQFAFFGVCPDGFSLGGGAIVIIGVILTACRKWVEELPLEDKKRQTFKFLLL